MRSTRAYAFALAVAVALLGGTAMWWHSARPRAEPLLPIVIARLQSPHSGLIHIAQARGYFAAEGLDASIHTAGTGYEAINEMLAGKADVATSAETPIARTLAEGKYLKVISTIFTSQSNSGLVARKDRGIARPEDLKGKRIGFVLGTATHYELEAFMAFNDIALSSVTLAPGKPEELVSWVASGTIDAASVWTPYLNQMQEQLGGNALTFSPKQFYSEMTNIVVRADYVSRHREETDRLLRALEKAESFADSHPDEAALIVATASGLSPQALRGQGEPLTHELTLKQSLVLATENEVRWWFRRGLVPPGPFPDVLDAFETEPLRALKPTAVTVSK